MVFINRYKRVKILQHLVLGSIKSFADGVFKYNTFMIRRGFGKGLRIKGHFSTAFDSLISSELVEQQFLSSLQLQNKVVFDVGAHIGITAMFFARAVGAEGQVIAFEPNPRSCHSLRENIAINNFSNIKIFEVGLGDAWGMKTLVASKLSDATGTVDSGLRSEILKEKHVQFLIRTCPLDSIRLRYNLPRPDLIKIDVEGVEYTVLKGMKETICECAPSLFIEIHCSDVNDRTKRVERILEFLDNFEYSVFQVENEKRIVPTTPRNIVRGHIFAWKVGTLICSNSFN